MQVDKKDDSHLGNRVLIVVYDRISDLIPLSESSRDHYSWEHESVVYEQGYIISGRAHLIGRKITFFWDKGPNRITKGSPYVEITPAPGKTYQFFVKNIKIWNDTHRPLKIPDKHVREALMKKEEWTYADAELLPVSPKIGIMR
jgi:hypothetical protein